MSRSRNTPLMPRNAELTKALREANYAIRRFPKLRPQTELRRLLNHAGSKRPITLAKVKGA